MTNASNQMARNFAGAIARVWRICSELGIKNRKHAMLWVFQVFALSAVLCGCQVWATNTHVQIICNNQSPHPPCLHSKDVVEFQTKHKHTLPSKRDRSAVFRCVARFWNSLLTSNNALLSTINEANLRLAHQEGSWTFGVLSALDKITGTDVHASAIMSHSKINTSDFELLLCEQTILEKKRKEKLRRR